jgi:polar amino acid transport system ATP-binding protein/sulfate transport system ATP-binding protein
MTEAYKLGDDILEVENVSLELGGKLILRDINIKIQDVIRPSVTTGQIIGFLGPSGRGKTQLFKILSGLNKPTTGTVKLGTEKKIVQAGDVGVVAQNYPLFEYMTVYGNLEYVCRIADEATTGLNFLKKKSKMDALKKEKIDFYLDRFKMTEHKDKYPALLSGGQRQRVAIIQQMLCSEYFILMDEPFSGLDPLMTTQVCQMIETVANLNEKNTIIVVSHDIPSTIAIAQYIWLLGYDYDENKKPIPGARIKYMENLMDRGLAWKPDLVNSPEFFSFVKDVRNTFNEL